MVQHSIIKDYLVPHRGIVKAGRNNNLFCLHGGILKVGTIEHLFYRQDGVGKVGMNN